MKKREEKDYSVEKRSLMYSQIFNYNINRDGTRTIDVSAAVAGGGKSVTNKRNYYIGLAVIVIVIALVTIVSFASEDIAVGINRFMLKVSGVEMQLPEPEAVEFDYEAFLKEADSGVDFTTDRSFYDKDYSQWSEVPLADLIEVQVENAEKLRFSYYEIRVYEDEKVGRVKIVAMDDEPGIFNKQQYTVNGIFKIADYTEPGTVLADKGSRATFVHEAENGNKAYFIRNWTHGTYTVYFVVGDILFEMEIDSSKRAVENAKAIIEAI